MKILRGFTDDDDVVIVLSKNEAEQFTTEIGNQGPMELGDEILDAIQAKLADRLAKVVNSISLADRLDAEADEVHTWDACPVQLHERRLRQIAEELRGQS